MKKGKGVVLGALSAALALIIGCTPKPSAQPGVTTPPQNGDATIRFLHIWNEHSDTMEKIVRSIEAENEDMRVEITAVGWENLDKTITTAINADAMYDVFFQFASGLGSMQQKGMLLGLDDYVTGAWESSFIDGALEEYRVDGALCGLPYRGSGVVVIINQELFDQNGWEKPQTQAELVKLMEDALAEGLIPMSVPGRPDGFQLDALRGIVTDYIAQGSGLLEDEERLTARKTDWQGEMAMGARTVKDWSNKGYFGMNPLSVDETTAMNRFLSGKAAMLLCNTNDLHELREQTAYVPFKMSSFIIPGSDGQEKLFPNASFQDGFAVWAGTQQPEQATALLKGLTSKENGALWAEETLSVMSLKDVQCEDALLDEFNEYFDIAGKYVVRADYDTGNSDELRSQLFVDYMTSEMTADEYETNYEEIVKDAIRQAKKK